MTRKQLAATLTGLVLAASLSACGAPTATQSRAGSPAVTAPSSGAAAEVGAEHNAADTEFAQMMIVHHEGAIEMAELAVERAESPEVVALAERISAAQGPEIDQMTGWLQAWGEEVSPSEHDGMDHGGMEMDGMSQEEMMDHLGGLSGADFDTAFLEGMIAHHEGAVEMSETELAEGQNPEALALADKIIADQKAEIAEMGELLAG